MKKRSHIAAINAIDGHKATHTLCGRWIVGDGETRGYGVVIAPNPNDATCWHCRSIRDGRT